MYFYHLKILYRNSFLCSSLLCFFILKKCLRVIYFILSFYLPSSFFIIPYVICSFLYVPEFLGYIKRYKLQDIYRDTLSCLKILLFLENNFIKTKKPFSKMPKGWKWSGSPPFKYFYCKFFKAF